MTVLSFAHRMLALAALLTLGASAALFVDASKADTASPSWAKFDRQGNLLRPDGWRHWAYVGTPLTPNDLHLQPLGSPVSGDGAATAHGVLQCLPHADGGGRLGLHAVLPRLARRQGEIGLDPCERRSRMPVRVALVTGASSGIGLGVTRTLLEHGYAVVATA
jgi:hypothetical protein